MIKYKIGLKYQLVETYSIQTTIQGCNIQTQFIKLEIDGLLTIYKGYAWDGPSGPTPDIDSFMRASLVHDCLYQLMRLGLIDKKYKSDADLIMKKLCVEDDMWEILANIFYNIVKRVSKKYVTSAKKRPIVISPKRYR